MKRSILIAFCMYCAVLGTERRFCPRTYVLRVCVPCKISVLESPFSGKGGRGKGRSQELRSLSVFQKNTAWTVLLCIFKVFWIHYFNNSFKASVKEASCIISVLYACYHLPGILQKWSAQLFGSFFCNLEETECTIRAAELTEFNKNLVK